MSTGLSPNDIRNYEFSNQMRGYDKDEVREFLEQVAVTLETLKQENLKLSMQADSLKSQLEAVKQFETAIKDAAIDARKNADQTIANAKKQAEEILEQANKEVEEAVGSREQRIRQVEAQLVKLEATRTNYLSKLRDMIESHRDLINDIAEMKAPSIASTVVPEADTAPSTPSDSTPAASAPSKPTASSIPAPTPAAPPTPAPKPVESAPAAAAPAPTPIPIPTAPPVAAQPPSPAEPPKPKKPYFATQENDSETSFESLNPFEPKEPDSHSGTNGIEVEDSTEVSRHTLETIGTSATPDEPDRTEEANAPSRIVAKEAEAKPESPLDPELAAALENYQAANQETPELNRQPAPVVETTAKAEDIPPEFIPVGDDTAKTTAPQPEQASTDKIKTGNGDEESTEHNAIDIDQPMGEPQPKQGGNPAPEEIAQELDAVAAKFEEEMDKAARS